ncbi:MAG TPA: carbohydrate porin [Verrucomicrobiae bacterium]|nr:carbohydrate porin [Verrucomicrobiae bacterium]
MARAKSHSRSNQSYQERTGRLLAWAATCAALVIAAATANSSAFADENPIASTNDTTQQNWNWHAQGTAILDGHPGVPAKYSGPNSLNRFGEVQNTISLDLFAGARLWRGAEFHIDGLMWQGFGFSHTEGIEAFPNGEAYRVGTEVPNVVFARVFVRQTFGLGGEKEKIEDQPLFLAGEQDTSRITVTLGKFSAKDIFDNNAYANDPRTQFMSWGLVANEAWDYPADSLGFDTGMAIEWNEPKWTLRYGFFQVPRVSNGLAQDKNYTAAWAMVSELERRYAFSDHPGVVRLLAYLNRARMGSYEETVDNPALHEDITLTREYRYKYGFGLNAEQELIKGISAFTRLGWNDGRNEAWMYSDVDKSASVGLSVNGAFWHRTNDTYAVAGVFSGASRIHQQYFADGGLGILAGDGALNYGVEKAMETYYDFGVWKTIHATLDYQFVANPAFNRDRGPVHVFSARLHWEF